MAGEHIIFPQFRDEQAASRYPFGDSATLTAADGLTTLAPDVFIDAAFYPIGGGERAHISQIVVAVNKITITVATVNPAVTITAEYDPLRTASGQNTITFFDSYGRPAGIIIFNEKRIAEIYQWGFGAYTFSPAATSFVPTVCVPATEPGVRGLLINGEDFATGDVTLLGDAGVVLRVIGENVIRVDVVGVPLFNRFACEAAEKIKPPPRFVSTINNCRADEFGNFIITATNRTVPGDSTVLRIYPSDYGLIVDTVGGSDV